MYITQRLVLHDDAVFLSAVYTQANDCKVISHQFVPFDCRSLCNLASVPVSQMLFLFPNKTGTRDWATNLQRLEADLKRLKQLST